MMLPTWGPFLEGPKRFSHPETHRKILNLTITELFYSCILNALRGSLHTSSFRRIPLHFPRLDTDELKMALRAWEVSGAFKKLVPGLTIQRKVFIKKAQFKKFSSACEKPVAFCVKRLIMKHLQWRESEGQIPLVQGYQTLLFCTLLLLSFSFHTLYSTM